MAAAIPNRGWSPRRDPLTKARIEGRGKTCARNSLPLYIGEYQKQRYR